MQADLEVCRRELEFSRKKLEAAELHALKEEQRYPEEIAEVQARLKDISIRARAACLRGAEDHVVTQHALDATRHELREMCADVITAEAESEFSAVVCGDERRGEWREAEALASGIQRARSKCQFFWQERNVLEMEAACLQAEMGSCRQACEQETCELEGAKAALNVREETVAAYETRAQELRMHLHQVLLRLRASHEDTQREQQRLIAHVANLEFGCNTVYSVEGGEEGSLVLELQPK